MVSMFFGLPGCGKSTLACKFIKKYIKDSKVKNIYVNFPVTFDSPKIKIINNDDFGKYDLRDGVIIIDEATIFADSRGFKTFDKTKVQYLLLHRHYKVNILLFSQGYNAVDKKLRDLTVKLYYVKRCKWLKFLTMYCPIKYGIMFPQGENLGEIAEGYSELPLLAKLIFTRYCFRPRYYRHFDSYDAPQLPALPPRE